VIFWIPFSLGLLGLFLMILHPGSRGNALMINFGFIAVAGICISLMHELGHAFVGRVAGFKIFAVEIGIGPYVLEFKRFGIRWRLKKTPVGGRAYGLPLDIRGFRLKQTLFVLGGPAVNAILFLLAWKCRWLDVMLGQTRLSGFLPMQFLLVMNAAALIGNLTPQRTSSAEGRLPNDGLNIWLTWKQTPQTIAAIKAAYYSFEAEKCRRDHKLGEARRWLDEGLREFPASHTLTLACATYLVFENKLDEARQALVGLRTMLADDKALFPLLLNNIAYVDALIGSSELLAEADDYSQQALRTIPWLVHFKG
jgi:hypothetical protein